MRYSRARLLGNAGAALLDELKRAVPVPDRTCLKGSYLPTIFVSKPEVIRCSADNPCFNPVSQDARNLSLR